MRKNFDDIRIFDNNNMFYVKGIYKGIRVLIKVFDTREAAENYIKNDVL